MTRTSKKLPTAIIYQCQECYATRHQGADKPAPECGELDADMNRFPDGGWVRIEQWQPHGTMTKVSEIRNPFEGLLDDEGPDGDD